VSGSTVEVATHPVALDALACLRDAGTGQAAFAAALDRLGRVLAVRALARLPVAARTVRTPLADAAAQSVDPGTVVLLPILRAGLGFLPAFQALVPGSAVAMLGMVRDRDANAASYLDRVPPIGPGQHVVVLDPMLATGGSASFALRRLGDRGATGAQVTLVVAIAAPEGIEAVGQALPGVRVVAGAVDAGLDDHRYIVPGLGDAGDRLFGPPPEGVA